MKRISLLLLVLMVSVCGMAADDIYTMKWSKVATGMPADWYGSDQAKEVAENVLLYQKDNGGWMKNIEMHQPLTEAEKQEVEAAKGEHSCLDNGATTTEMTFLAKVYSHIKDERYKAAFNRGLQCIMAAQYATGGWPQYWPLRGGYSDFITFNDDLMTNVLELLRKVYQDQGDFADITDETTAGNARTAFDKGLQCILDCQIDDEGTKSIWCAQHEGTTLLPAEGRPHELPSFSGMESARILTFLMSVSDPSDAVKQAVTAAAEWFDRHATLDKKVQDVKSNGETVDREIVDAPGKHLWGRFMQLAGTTAQRAYDALLSRHAGEMRTVSAQNGATFRYDASDNFRNSYDSNRAYQNMYGIYDDTRQQLYYRPLYNYADSEPVLDANGVQIETSLGADNRRSYQYVGSWAEDAVYNAYPKWKAKYVESGGGSTESVELSDATHASDWTFNGGYSITNGSDKAYAKGVGDAVKYSRNVNFTIVLPAGVSVTAVKFYGYDNYADADAYLARLNGVTYSATDYVFPVKNADGPVYTEHTVTLQTPATGELPFRFEGQQVGMIITLFLASDTGVSEVTLDNSRADVYTMDGRLVKRAASEKDQKSLRKGVYIIGKKRVVVR